MRRRGGDDSHEGRAGTGDVVEAVRHMRTIMSDIRKVQNAREDELYVLAKELQAPLELVREVHAKGKLPVPNFSAGGIATPADAALMMKLGAETVFVGSGIFKSGDPAKRRAPLWIRCCSIRTRRSWLRSAESGRTDGGHQHQQLAGRRVVSHARLVIRPVMRVRRRVSSALFCTSFRGEALACPLLQSKTVSWWPR